MIDEKGRCCGRKPIKYKGGSWRSPEFPQRFCFSCNRAYKLDSDEQLENWAWVKNSLGEFERCR